MGIKRLLVTLTILIPQMALAWGRDGHQLIALVGSNLTTKGTQFWTANAQNMVAMSTVPDMYWKQGNLYLIETQTHFFQPDSYYSNPAQFKLIPHDFDLLIKQFGKDKAVANGSVLWRAGQFYQLALNALRQKDFKTAIQMAGALAHYIGDLSQPLHNTSNYDGQATHNPGIHKFFETTNIQANIQGLKGPVIAQAVLLMKNPAFQNQFSGSVVDTAYNESIRAYAFKDALNNTDLKFGREGVGAKQQLSLAKDRLADGAASLALILSHLWAESGLPDTGATGAITVPAWVPPNYYTPISNITLKENIDLQVALLQGVSADDCYQQ